ncbi:unnamed protein product [Brachionus calyciflorus]|uniref:MULE transposase domain-containing protein n=1 Tax=Brachionus calyciflorus TaxID=104777 RepID=A0A814N001_9BILA|nr:unnamed protein product [Brachionus calyciflorus]
MCVLMLLIGKSTLLYQKALNHLKNKCIDLKVVLNPLFIMSDYELAIMNACKSEFPDAEIKGCYFHMIQCLWKNIQLKGLVNEYKVENNNIWFEELKTLAFVPPTYVPTAYNYLLTVVPQTLKNNSKFSKFLNYFYETWMHGDFEINLWNQFHNNGPRTNNHLEGFHRKIDIDLIASHPNLYYFIDYIKKIEAQLVLTYKRRLISNDFNSKRRPEYIYRDNKIFKYKSLLSIELNEIPNGMFYFSAVNQVLSKYMSKCAHLYVYKKSENKKEDEIELSNNEITNKIDYHNQLLQNCFEKFTKFTHFGIELTKNDIERLKPKCWLNDNLVNYYLHLLSSSTRSRSMNFESYFYSSLIQRGH